MFKNKYKNKSVENSVEKNDITFMLWYIIWLIWKKVFKITHKNTSIKEIWDFPTYLLKFIHIKHIPIKIKTLLLLNYYNLLELQDFFEILFKDKFTLLITKLKQITNRYNEIKSPEIPYINFVLQNLFIHNKKYLISNNFPYQTDFINIDNLQDLLNLRKDVQWINTYIWKKLNSSLFSLLDMKVKEKICWKHEKWKKINIWDQHFFEINWDTWAKTNIQLYLNRLFAPLFPMTRLIKLTNWNTKFVSVDVWNEIIKWDFTQGIDICWFKDNISENIKDIFVLIYQFLAKDTDRQKGFRNISKNWIIFDFNYISRFSHVLDYEFKNPLKNPWNEIEKLSNFFYILKNYIHSLCETEKIRLNNELSNCKNIQRITIIKDNLKIIDMIYVQEKQLTLINLASFCRIDDEKILDLWFNQDKLYFNWKLNKK